VTAQPDTAGLGGALPDGVRRGGFEPGRLVLRRHFLRGQQLGRVWVGRVAADDGYGLWIWIDAGSPWLDVTSADGRRIREMSFAEFGAGRKAMTALRWSGPVLMLHQPATANSTWFFFDADGGFRRWYVNLERPGVRWDDGDLCGLDTVDYDLDVVAQPDRSWAWKDEDEFVEHLAHPDVYWCDDEAAVRAEGARVVKLIEAGEFPFDGTGTSFRADPAWAVPDSMPPGWDRPRAW
jgi:hypothetical protein